MAGTHKRNVKPMQAAVRCGAKTRSGHACKSPAVNAGKRCRMHGGKGSGAPAGNRNALKNGVYTAKMRERARRVRTLILRVEALIAGLTE